MEKKRPFKTIAVIATAAALVIILGAPLLLSENFLNNYRFEPGFLMALLNVVFLGLTSLVVSYAAARSYLKIGASSILFLGKGALIFGFAGMLAEWFTGTPTGANIMVTIYNSSALLAGLLYYTATMLEIADLPRAQKPPTRKRNLFLSYAAVLLIALLLLSLSLRGQMPAFFVQGIGPTLLRQAVVGLAVALLFFSGLLHLLFYGKKKNDFLFWYALALITIAIGLLGSLLQHSLGGIIGWTSRLAQYVGGVYLLAAVLSISTRRSFEGTLVDLFQRPGNLYAAMFENSLDGILVAARGGTVLAANPRALDMLGYDAAEIRTLSVEDLSGNQGAGGLEAGLLSGDPISDKLKAEMTFARKDGTHIPVGIASTIFKGKRGEPLEAILFRDLSYHKQVEQELREAHLSSERYLAQLNAVVNQMTEGLALFDSQGSLLRLNPAASKIFDLAHIPTAPISLDRLARLMEMTDMQGKVLATEMWPVGRVLNGETFATYEVRFRLRGKGAFRIGSFGGAPVHDRQGKLLLAIVTVRDITEKKMMEQALVTSEQRAQQAAAEATEKKRHLQVLLENSPQEVTLFDAAGAMIYSNPAGLKQQGFENPEESGGLDMLTTAFELYTPGGMPVPISEWPLVQALRGETIREKEYRILNRRTGLAWTALVYATPVRDEKGDVSMVVLVNQDITHIREAEAALRESEERFRTLADNISQFAWMADEKGFIFWFNKRWFDYTGTTLENARGWGWTKIHHPDHVQRVVQRIQHSWDTGEPWEDTFPLRSKDGSYGWFLSRAQPIHDDQGRILRWFGTHTDVTHQLQAEEQIKKSLEEKGTLLQEIHHRVKNNMQVIIGLLNLQSAKIKDEKVKDLFRESSSRVNAMALIHNILYQSDSLTEIDLNPYFNSLAHHLVGMYNASGIQIRVQTDHLALSIDHAIPCGLIINELISNALKYAFPDNRRGEIKIEAHHETADHYVMIVSDNGVGLPAELDIHMTNTLGLKLVSGLAESQLGGNIWVERDQGTRFIIRIPLAV